MNTLVARAVCVRVLCVVCGVRYVSFCRVCRVCVNVWHAFVRIVPNTSACPEAQGKQEAGQGGGGEKMEKP